MSNLEKNIEKNIEKGNLAIMKKKVFISFLALIIFISVALFFLPKHHDLNPKNKSGYFVVTLRKYLPRFSSDELNKSIEAAKDTERETLRLFFEEFISSERSFGHFLFKKDSKQPVNIRNKTYVHEQYSTNFFNAAKNSSANKGSAYLAVNNNILFIVQANGLFYWLDLEDLEKSSPRKVVSQISSNILNQINFVDFFINSYFGIKDVLIIDEYLYVSYTKQQNKDCYTTAIMRAEINLKKLEFEPFYQPNICVLTNNDYGEFQALQSGGRMVSFKNNQLLFALGEYRYRDHAQNLENTLGKIISIDLETKDTKIISMGHRNVQGLFYDKTSNKIWSTEHGPEGGDEINVNRLDENSEIKNYGWPIASYGEHYGMGKFEDIEKSRKLDPRYKKAPLLKSHSAMGFIEPVIFYTPSIGISQIIKIKLESQEDIIVMGSMGTNVKEGDMSLHIFGNDGDIPTPLEILPLNERIRDLILVKNPLRIFYTGETTGKLGIIHLE